MILDVLILFFIEIIEANLSRGETLASYIDNLRVFRAEHPIGFWGICLSFFYVAFYAIVYDHINIWILAILITKYIDIYLKSKISRNENFPAYLNMGDFVISPFIRYSGACFYPLLFYVGITQN